MTRRDAALLAGLLAALALVGLLRPLLPIDETRYASVAWEMWARGDFLVPHRNGEAYHHKPPLLFWLIHAGWWLFGVNEWWPRLISPLFAAGTLALTAWLARALWPGRPAIARMAPYLLLACLLYTYFATALMFDAMLAFFAALGLVGIVRAWQGARTGFVLLALGLGGALYAKGPVALVHLLPAALLAPWWMRERRPAWRNWYLGVLAAVLGGAGLILAWAIPAAAAGGPEYARAIFWGQSAGRMAQSFAHRAPWWFYFAWLPVMLAPWLLWPRWWKGLRGPMGSETGTRLALVVVLAAFFFFTVISGKRWHYLLPEFALFALLVARALDGTRGGRWSLLAPALMLAAAGAGAVAAAPRLAARLGGLDDASALVWGGAGALLAAVALLARRADDAVGEVRRTAVATLAAFCALALAFDVAMREPYDVAVVAARLSEHQREGRPVAFEGEYHGQWHLSGRLREPLVEVPRGQAMQWLASHPQGRVVVVYRKAEELPAGAHVELSRRYRGAWLAIVGAP
jgi:4-amino-4-deoxy-L-arabinose transferase-like glycosyltransferase